MACNAKRGVLRGIKMSKNHSTYLIDAGELILALKELDCVKKISIGQINRCRNGKKRAYVKQSQGNLHKVQIRGNTGVQSLSVVCSDIEALNKTLKEFA